MCAIQIDISLTLIINFLSATGLVMKELNKGWSSAKTIWGKG